MQNKKAVVALVCAAMLVIQAVDVFFIKSNQTVFADYIVATAVKLAVLFVTVWYLKFNLKRRCLNQYGCLFEMIYGLLFSSASLLVVYGAELIYFKIKGYLNLSISLSLPNGATSPLSMAFAAYTVSLLLNLLFEELFRGFMISQLGESVRFKTANVLQAILFTMLTSISLLYSWASGSFDDYEITELAIIVFSSIFGSFIGSMKWGFYYRVNGSVWMALVDHFFNSFAMTCIFFSRDRLPEKWLLAKSLVVQIVSCVIFIPFYYRRDRANSEIAKEAKLRREVLSSMKKGYDEGDSEALDEMLLMMNDTNQNKKFGTSSSNEIQNLDKSPAELSREFFESSFGAKQAKKSSAATDSKVDSEAEISKLTKAYFDRQIKK